MERPEKIEIPATPIIVLGATSKTGTAAIKSLLASSSHQHIIILAVVRSTKSSQARNLAALLPAIRIIPGNANDANAIFNAASEVVGAQPIHGVFDAGQSFDSKWTARTEIARARAVIDCAVVNKITHFVLASSDRGLPPSLDSPQLPPRFSTKQEIEDHLLASTAASNMSCTILRSTCLMENLTPDMRGRAFATWWQSSLTYTKPLALVSAVDVGFLATQAFLKWSHPTYHNRILTLAGDNLTFAHADRIFRAHRGYGISCAPQFVARVLEKGSEDVCDMLRWCDKLGFGSEIPALRKVHPGLLGFGEWVERYSGFGDRRKDGKV